MTEAEWLSSNDPARMLQVVSGGVGTLKSWRASDRKLRLFACACCRQVWAGVACERCGGKGYSHMARDGYIPAEETCPACRGTGRVGGLTDPRSRHAVEVAERYADGKATDGDMACAAASAAMLYPYEGYPWVRGLPLTACQNPADRGWTEQLLPRAKHGGIPPATQADLLRCIAGNPFRPVRLPKGPQCWMCDGEGKHYKMDGVFDCERCGGTGIDTCPWLTHNDGAVPKLAQAIYDSRRWDELPILADALEEAGCPSEVECPRCGGKRLLADPAKLAELLDRPMSRENAVQIIESARAGIMGCKPCDCGTGTVPNPILAHLRGPGPHARGCHVLDLLLGKE